MTRLGRSNPKIRYDELMELDDYGDDEFLNKAMRQLDALARLRRELVSRIEEIQAALRLNDEERAELERTVASYTKFMDIPDYPTRRREALKPRVAHGDLPRGAYGPLVLQALVELGGEASLGDIVDWLRSQRRIPAEEHSYYSTRSALNRHERIVKTEKGFRLREFEDPEEASSP
jgi:hypothetical protein